MEADFTFALGQSVRAIKLFAIAISFVIAGSAHAAETAANKGSGSLAILPFEIEDNSGEFGTSEKHDAMLSALTQAVGKELEVLKLYNVVPEQRVRDAVNVINPGTYLRRCNGCEFDIARKAGAQFVMIGWIFKMSTLIGTLHLEIKDVETGRTVYSHAFDFRGDDTRAWERAAKYFGQTLAESQQTQ